jgi:hypothetical protein
MNAANQSLTDRRSTSASAVGWSDLCSTTTTRQQNAHLAFLAIRDIIDSVGSVLSLSIGLVSVRLAGGAKR